MNLNKTQSFELKMKFLSDPTFTSQREETTEILSFPTAAGAISEKEEKCCLVYKNVQEESRWTSLRNIGTIS